MHFEPLKKIKKKSDDDISSDVSGSGTDLKRGMRSEAQEKFHKSTLETLDYMVGPANVIVGNLQNFSTSLASAKSVGVVQIFLPVNVQGNIDRIQTKLNTSADGLAMLATKNSNNIKTFLDSMQLYLIIIAAVMLFLAFVGFYWW